MVLINTGLFFGKTAMFANVVPEVTSWQEVHHQVQIFTILESIVHVDDEWIVELSQDLSLIHHWFDASFRYDTSLRHLFHGIWLLSLLPFDLPYFSESSLADAV